MRKEKDWVATEDRDAGKMFRITEMPAMQAAKWADRAFLALAKSGVDIPQDISNQGMIGIAILGIRTFGGVSYVDAEPLVDELMRCVTIVPNKALPLVTRPVTGQDDIEEVKTIYQLRQEVIELHLGFTFAESVSKLTSGSKT